jgi:type II secretory pathway component GspD/PulD (secretin)
MTKGRAKLLASPNISVVDNEDANIFIGDLRRFPGSLATTQTAVLQAIETIPLGIILLVRPSVNPDDGSVTMRVHPVVSSFSGFDHFASGDLPRTSSREADTTVRLMKGEELVIGGLTQTETTRNETRVPILGQLPFGIGELFTSRSRTDRKTEIVVIIRAYSVLTDTAPAKDFRKGVEQK